MAVMLRREELVFRRERPIDGAYVEIPPVWGGDKVYVCWNIRERHQRLAFSERRQCPFRESENTQSGECQTSLQHFTAGLTRHVWFSFIKTRQRGGAGFDRYSFDWASLRTGVTLSGSIRIIK